jgi:hypothetical protein
MRVILTVVATPFHLNDVCRLRVYGVLKSWKRSMTSSISLSLGPSETGELAWQGQ